MRKHIFLTLLISIIITIFACGCGDDGTTAIVNPTSIPNPTPGTNTSTITGTVYGTGGGPLAGASVRLTPLTSSEAYGEVQNTTTDGQGRFTFTVSFAGTYLIEAMEGNNLLGSQEFTIALGSSINITLGQATGRLTVQITPANAVATVSVSMISSTSEAELSGSQSGEFIFYLPAGTYTMNVSATGYNPVTRSGITLALGEERTETVDLTGQEIPIGLLSNVEPRVIVNANLSTVTMRICSSNFTGTGTDNNITATLTPSSGGTAINGTNITVLDSSTIEATFDLTGASSGEYNLTVNHAPITTSDSGAGSTVWLTDTIQVAVDRANLLYTSESLTNPVTAFVPGGIYQAGTGALTALPVYMKSGVHLQGPGLTAATPASISATAPVASAFNVDYIDNSVIEGFVVNGTNIPFVVFTNVGYYNLTITNNRFSGINGTSNIYLINTQQSPVTLTVSNNTIENNAAGSAIFLNLNLTSSGSGVIDIRGNNITGNHGGIFIDRLFYNALCTITGNTITGCGNMYPGAVFIQDIQFNSSCSVTGDNVITDNTLTRGIYSPNITDNSSLTVSGNDISRNGGAIYTNFMDSTLDISGNRLVDNNTVGVPGGAIFATGGNMCTANISGNRITGNQTGGNPGGAMYLSFVNQSNLSVINNLITGNNTGNGVGGGLFIAGDISTILNVSGNEISGNASGTALGGGLYVGKNSGTGDHINQNNIYNNTGTGNGLQVYYPGPPTLDLQNNWWGHAVPPALTNTEVFDVVTPNVNVNNPAGSAFPLPSVPQ